MNPYPFLMLTHFHEAELVLKPKPLGASRYEMTRDPTLVLENLLTTS